MTKSIRGINEKIAVTLFKLSGSMWTFWVLVLWYTGWIFANNLLGKHAFDPAPWVVLLFWSNTIQLLYLPILQSGSNLINRFSQARDEEQYDLVRRIDKVNDQQHQMLENGAAVMEAQSKTLTALISIVDRLDRISAANNQILNQLIKQTAEIVEELEDDSR